MNKRTLAALTASMVIGVSAVGSIAVPQMAYAQASDATAAAASAPATATAQAATPSADQPAPPPAPATSETVNNPYGLGALWKNGDFVARFVLILLVIMSMGSWYIMITKFLEQFRANRRAKSADEQLWTAPSLRSEEHTSELQSPVHLVC